MPAHPRSRGRLVAAWSLALCLVAPQAALAWWNDDWAFRKSIDIDLEQAGLPTAQGEVPVLVRLHAGNFAYFLDAAPNGEDLRFIAADDQTPLAFHVERFDGVAGIGAIWVQVPRLDPAEPRARIYMYYGNAEATAAGDAAATFDVSQTAVHHFNEAAGLPRDATAFGHDATRSSAATGPGIVDAGLKLTPETGMAIAGTPALGLDPARGTTLSLWLRPDSAAEQAVLFRQRDAAGRAVTVGLRDMVPFVEVDVPLEGAGQGTESAGLVAGTDVLDVNRWYHLVVTLGSETTLWIDGAQAARAPLPLPKIGGDIAIGATDGLAGFRGAIDELRIASVIRPDAWIALQYALQSQDLQLVIPGEDESRDKAGGGLAEYLGLLWALLGAVRLEGWVILGCLVLMGLLSLDVMVNKSALLKKLERADRDFMDDFDRRSRELEPDEGLGATDQDSPLGCLQAVAAREVAGLRGAAKSGKADFALPPEALEVVRSALDAEMVEQTDRLTRRLVLMTIAVSGGPFLGLLGTVVGVMITFAAIAAAGDVNVNTIAPGVSAALITTVMGLLVAIPSLFGYNWLTTRIARRTTAMEVFADRLVSRLAVRAVAAAREGVSRAA